SSGEVKQPGRDDTAAPPHFRDVAQIEIVTIELRIAQRRRFRISRVLLLAGVRMAQDVHPFSVGRHDPVLYAVMDHLDEVPGPVPPAVRVTELGGAPNFLPSRGARDTPRTGR